MAISRREAVQTVDLIVCYQYPHLTRHHTETPSKVKCAEVIFNVVTHPLFLLVINLAYFPDFKAVDDSPFGISIEIVCLALATCVQR